MDTPGAGGREGTLTIVLAGACLPSVSGGGATGFFGKQHGPPAVRKLEQPHFHNVLQGQLITMFPEPAPAEGKGMVLGEQYGS